MRIPYFPSTIFLIVAIWYSVQLPQLCSSDTSYENMTTLMKYLIGSESGYDPDIRPLDNQSEQVVVNIEFALVSLVEVDDVKQQFTMNGFLGMNWDDERVRWDSEDYGGIVYVSPQPKQIWRPRMFLLNTLGDRDLFKDDYSPLHVYNDGTVFWSAGGIVKASCGLNMNKYPFDSQSCFMLFCPMSHFADGLVFVALKPAFALDFFVANEGWVLTSSIINIIEITTGGPDDVLSCAKLDFKVKRRPGFFILNIILPVLLLSFLNNFVFIIPDESGEKIGYGITVLLSLSVFLSTVSAMIPRSSNNIPAISIYLFVLLATSVVSILASMLVVWLHHREEAEETHATAQANYKQAVKKVFRMQRALSKVDSEETVRRRTSPEVNPENEFGMNEAKDTPPKPNKYKIISKHINKVCFFGSMLIWATVNVTFFIYTS